MVTTMPIETDAARALRVETMGFIGRVARQTGARPKDVIKAMKLFERARRDHHHPFTQCQFVAQELQARSRLSAEKALEIVNAMLFEADLALLEAAERGK